jgi:hypothetical protein
MDERTYQKHKDCDTVIIWRPFKNQSWPVPGLYCKQHLKWQQWLTVEQADQLIAEGIEVVAPYDKKPSISLDSLGI